MDTKTRFYSSLHTDFSAMSGSQKAAANPVKRRNAIFQRPEPIEKIRKRLIAFAVFALYKRRGWAFRQARARNAVKTPNSDLQQVKSLRSGILP
jgi:hypothetical protein